MFRNLALIFVGLSAGGIIAAGVFAFLVIIGVFPRLIGEDRDEAAHSAVRNANRNRGRSGKYRGSV